jgi:arylsulfatase A-like enzyme
MIAAWTRSRHALGWILLAALLSACGAWDRGAEVVVHRLVDVEHRQGVRLEPPTLVARDTHSFPTQTGSFARIPLATLHDDTRPVLAAHASALLAYQQPLLEATPGSREVLLPLGAKLPGASELVVVAQVQAPGQLWRRLEARLTPVAHREGRRFVSFELPADLPRSEGGRMHVMGHRPPGKRTVYQTAPLRLPRHATLEVALGVLEPAAGEGPVRFAVEACRADACVPIFEETLDPASQTGRGWQDRRVALSALGGEERSLRFVAEHVGTGDFTLPVWGDPTVVAPASGRERRPNLVLLSIDTLRQDHLDLYGYGRETAPFLRDRIAARGVVFERLIAEAATTDPSHMTMFTSLPALVHGVQCCQRGLAVPVVTLAEVLRANGYRTAAFTENGPLDQAIGFSLGFDRYVENKTIRRPQPTGQVARTFEQARQWLEAHPEGPFFLFLHTFQVHGPHDPPVEYQAHFPEPRTEVLPQARPLVDGYDREIRYVDDQLALLHGWTEERGFGDDTIWIVLSDHGEEFLEHGSLGHATLPYETVLRVPLVVQGPGIREGVRDATLLRHVDFMPTVLELAGVEAPHGLLGESFAELLTGRGDDSVQPADRTAFTATWVLPKGFDAPALSVRMGDRKLIRYRRDGREHLELYDLAADPSERRNLAAEEPEELERLRKLLDRHEQGTREWRRRLARGGAADAHALPLDPDREEMLRSLGYIE